MEDQRTRYAKEAGAHIAYQVIGDGALDLVLVPNWISHVEAMWEVPSIARYLERLTGFSRVITYDQLGSGLSDPVSLGALPTAEQRVDELRAVMDHAGSERAAVIGFETGGRIAILFAATHPDRTVALVLVNTSAKARPGDGYPYGMQEEVAAAWLDELEQAWGVESVAPSSDPLEAVEAARWARYQRQAASPATLRAFLLASTALDVRSVLPSIRVPTLVVVRDSPAWRSSGNTREGHGRYLAEHIPGAAYHQFPDASDPPDLNVFVDEIREFLTGVREAPEPDRVLATVLFTDIVGSTDLTTSLGDDAWRRLLDAHDDMVKRQLERFRGRAIKTLGDGFLAVFDGPARAIRCACAIRGLARRMSLEVRIGVHTGECEVRGEDLGGIAVHIASRVSALAGPSEVLVSRTVTDLVTGSELKFVPRGAHSLKGIPGIWEIYAVDTDA